jgi:hypothetical protein
MICRLNFIGVAAVAFLLCGCSFDHRKDVAYRMLYREDGFENDSAFSAAISAKFPPGTAVVELQRFAAASGDKCWSKDPGGYTCEIATRGQFCAAGLIRIEATVEDGTIKSVSFISGGLGC